MPSPAPCGTRRSGAGPARIALALLALLVCFLPHSTHAQQLFSEDTDSDPRAIDSMYVRGLRHLVNTQSEQGDWPGIRYGSDAGVVGLAVMAMLAHGDDPNYGPYSTSIRRGLDHILSQMDEKNGYIGRTMYNHGFATLALAESYGMVDDQRLGPALKKAVELIVASQVANPFGAWRYNPGSVDADTTVSGCQLVALFAARNAGIAVPEEAIQKGMQFFARCQSPQGGFGYTNNAGPNAARTAIGCLVMVLAQEKNSDAYRSAFAFLEQAEAQSHYYYYYLYYASQANFHHSHAAWQKWNQANIQSLKKTQRADGSWDGQFGTTFSTAASLLSLALNYRYLPIYERQAN